MPKQTTNWTTGPAIWLVVILVILLGRSVSAATPTNPEEYCWEQQAAFISEGVEMPIGPIETTGDRWNIIWENGSEDSISADQISVPFADGVEHISGNTPMMADHVLTLNMHWAAGREPFAVRYEGTIFLIVPYWDNETQEAWCAALPLQQ